MFRIPPRLAALALLLAPLGVAAQTPGTLNLQGPSTSPGAPQMSLAALSAAINQQLALKADVGSGGGGAIPSLSSPPPIGNTVPSSGAFTALSATGTSAFATASAAWITATGGASATLGTGGTGNLALNVRSAGTGAVNIGGSAFSALQVLAAATNGGILQVTQPVTATLPSSSLINIGTSNTTNGGLNFISPIVFTKNIAYAGARSDTVLNRPFTLSQTVTGTSNNTAGFGINLISTALNSYQSYAGTRALDILLTSGAGTTAIPMVGISVHTQQSAAPPTVAALQWLASHAYTPVGALVVNGVNLYQLTTAGTSAASGGPTGTGSGITDGTAVWTWQDNAGDVYRNIGADILASSNFSVGAASIDAATGQQYGMVLGSNLGASAVHYSQSVVLELDDNVDGSVNRSVALQIAKEGANQGDVYDYGIWVNAIGAAKYRNMFFASSSTDANGVVFSVSDQSTGSLQTMAGVFDCLMCNPSGSNTQAGWFVTGGGGYILRSANSQWRGSGDLQIGNAGLAISANTLTIDTTYRLLTAVGALSGGTSWTTGDQAVDDFGNVATVTASAGVPTSLSIVAKPKTYVAAGSVPGGSVTWHSMHTASASFVAATGGRVRKTDFTCASETYTSGNLIALGGTANVRVGSGTALATNATTGMLLIPSMAGTPTGNVGALGGVALNYDSTNKKLCVTIGATVECTAAMTP